VPGFQRFHGSVEHRRGYDRAANAGIVTGDLGAPLPLGLGRERRDLEALLVFHGLDGLVILEAARTPDLDAGLVRRLADPACAFGSSCFHARSVRTSAPVIGAQRRSSMYGAYVGTLAEVGEEGRIGSASIMPFRSPSRIWSGSSTTGV
jgi:hypothetical protein